MADNLIFPIGFDLEKGVEQAQGDWATVQKKMETMINSKPLRIPIHIEQSKELLDADGNIKAATGSIKALRAEMKALITRWEELSQAERLTTDSNGKFIGEAGQIVNRFAELTAASRTYARSLSELQSAADKAVVSQERSLLKQQAEDEKAYQKWLATKEKEVQKTEELERKKENARLRVIAKQNETQRIREEQRYDTYWKNAEKEAAKAEAAEAKKRAAYAATTSAFRQAAHEQAQAAFKVAQTLKAQEDSINAITAKLQIYQQQVRGQKIGTDEWNKSALEIRRLSEELQKASQNLSDFQQKSFKGLSDSLTTDKVQALTQYRAELAKIEAQFNKLNQTGAAYNDKGGLTTEANKVLKQRQDLLQKINQMLTTAADAQVQREKEINRIIEQRKAKADAILAKRREEQAAIRANIANLKAERRVLNQQENTIANISAKLQIQQKRLQTATLGSAEFTKTAKEVERLTIKLEKAKGKIDELTKRTIERNKQQADSFKAVAKEINNQTSYIERVGRRLLAYWSIQQVSSFLTNVREVTAEFELQRVSLGAIIQDQTRANRLFGEIKAFALKSPVKIMDLTKYTKQLAAYKIGVEELFDTTKRLTDISVGLGVSMDRVVLAYGQVRATGHLRASEVRQFTEMGVPIVEELASKLTKLNGTLVTSADVLAMISERAISFELVKDVFDDMTSAGGMFYNMQEKQGNTLFGMWAKLGDAASVMYDQIGNTESVNKGMKTAIELLTNLMRNWRGVAFAVQFAASSFLLYKTASSVLRTVQINSVSVAAATESMARASKTYRAAQASGNVLAMQHANLMRKVAVWNRQAALSTNLFTVALNKLKVAFVTLGPMALVAGLTVLVSYLYNAYENATRLRKTLEGITADTTTEISRMVTNFVSLADKSVKAAEGSKEQRDALAELQRTYRNIIPEQELTIQKLREMKGDYTNLTIAIREYARTQQLQRGLDAIADEKGKAVLDAEREFQQALKDIRLKTKDGALFSLDEGQIDRIVRLFKELVMEGKSAQQALQTAFQFEGIDNLADSYTQIASELGILQKARKEQVLDMSTETYLTIEHEEAAKGLTAALKDLIQAEKDFKKQMDDNVPTLGMFTKYIDAAKKSIEDHVFISKENTFAFDLETAKVQIDAYIKALENALKDSGVKIDLSQFITIDKQGIKNFDFTAFNAILSNINTVYKIPLMNLTKEIKTIYEGFIPSDPVAKQIRQRFIKIAEGMGVSSNLMRNYLWDGQTALSDHIKSLKENVTKYEAEIYRMNAAIAKGGLLGMLAQQMYGGKIAELTSLINALNSLINFEQSYVKPEDNKRVSKATDQRLSILQEYVSTLKTVNKEYEDLRKKEGERSALDDMQLKYAKTFAYMRDLAKKYKFSLPAFTVPTDAKSLTQYLKTIKNVMKKLPKSDKAVLTLEADIAGINIEEQQKKLEKQLKTLADNITRTKTAEEFYSRILSTTGDVELALSVTTSIYGDAGTNVQAQLAEYVRTLFGQMDVQIPLNLIVEDGTIDYKAMEKFVMENEAILGNNYSELLKIAREGQKDLSKIFDGYLKDLEKAKTYADKRIELARDTANKIAEINKQNLPKDVKDRLIAGYTERESREIARLEYEAFKDTPLYVQMFEDLEYASTYALEAMRTKLLELQNVWGTSLDPTQLKEIQSRMNEIDTQLRNRNPFKTLSESVKEYRSTLSEYTTAGAEAIVSQKQKDYDKIVQEKGANSKEAISAEKTLMVEKNRLKIVKQLTNEKGKQLKGQKALDKAMQLSNNKEKEAWKELEDALANEKAARDSGKQDEIKKAKVKVEAAKKEYELAQQTSKLIQKQTKTQKTLAENLSSTGSKLLEISSAISQVGDSVAQLMESLGSDKNDVQYIRDISQALGDIFGGAGNILQSLMKGDLIGAIVGAITSPIQMAKGFVNLFSAGAVRKANKEIERQQEIIDNLEYTYNRLAKAMEKAFGNEYITNYYQQQKILQSEIIAKQKQLYAERSKGKKKDKDAIKQYEEQIRDLKDQLEDLKDTLTEFFLGTDITSAARDFASAWLEARKSFEDTTLAMEENFKDMIQNMIVESMAGEIMKNALQPFYDAIEEAAKDGELSASDIAEAVKVGLGSIEDMNKGMEVLWEQLKAAGVDVNRFLTDKKSGYTGIAKDIAGATSEEINAVAAIGNTMMYHTSFLPLIYQRLTEKAVGNTSQQVEGGQVAWTDWQQQAMSAYMAIQQNTADTVVECRRSAQACETIANQLARVIKAKGGNVGINTFLTN